MKGHHNNGLGKEWAEINGAEASVVYELSDPSRVLMGAHGESLRAVPVPAAFAPRCVAAAAAAGRALPGEKQKDPSFTFRYDLVYEFVSAIVDGRDAEPGFEAGAAAQTVCDAVLESFAGRRWVDLDVSEAHVRHRRTTHPASYDARGEPMPPPGAPPPGPGSVRSDGTVDPVDALDADSAGGAPFAPPPPPATPPPDNQLDAGGAVAWTCASCGSSNAALSGACDVCGAPRAAESSPLLINQLKRSGGGGGGGSGGKRYNRGSGGGSVGSACSLASLGSGADAAVSVGTAVSAGTTGSQGQTADPKSAPSL